MHGIRVDDSSTSFTRGDGSRDTGARSRMPGFGHRSVRARLMGIVAVGALLAVIVGLAGLNGVARVNAARGADLVVTDVQLSLANIDADRAEMGDAVLDSVLAVQSRSAAGLADAQREYTEGARELRADFQSAVEQGLKGPLQADLWAQWPQLAEFVSRGQSVMLVVHGDATLAAAQLESFDRFSTRTELAAHRMGSRLDAASLDAENRASAATRMAHVEIYAIGGIALLMLLGLAWRLGRSIIGALRGVGDTAAAITTGDLDARTTVTGDDEIGTLGIALNEMAESLRGLFARLGDEARRDAFSSQLAEAFEIADTVPDAYAQVERAMSAIADDLPMELLLADSSGANLDLKADHPIVGGPGCPVQTPYSCVAVRRGSAAVFDSSEALNACPMLRDRPGGACSAVCIPVTFMGRALGVLHTTAADGIPPNPQQVVRLTALAAQAGSTIGTVRSTETNIRQATTDGLTGLINRRTLENEMRALIEADEPFAVSMADVDHFKIVNDTFGHQAGDRALRLFSQVMQAHVRADDIVGRYGGEEFVLLFPGQSAQSARETLERLRAELASAQTDGGTPRFTASYGLADSGSGRSVDEILAVADSALAIAKREGRDRVVVADELRVAEVIETL